MPTAAMVAAAAHGAVGNLVAAVDEAASRHSSFTLPGFGGGGGHSGASLEASPFGRLGPWESWGSGGGSYRKKLRAAVSRRCRLNTSG